MLFRVVPNIFSYRKETNIGQGHGNDDDDIKGNILEYSPKSTELVFLAPINKH